MSHDELKELIANAFATKWSKDFCKNTNRKMMFGSSQVPNIILIKEVLDSARSIILAHPRLMTEQCHIGDVDRAKHHFPVNVLALILRPLS